MCSRGGSVDGRGNARGKRSFSQLSAPKWKCFLLCRKFFKLKFHAVSFALRNFTKQYEADGVAALVWVIKRRPTVCFFR